MSADASGRSSNPRDIFLRALELEGPERAAYLDQACGTDAGLRARVQALLRAHRDDGFLERPAIGLEETVAAPNGPFTEGPGTVIGRYKLLEQIGEGGMGVVYMAEQEQPVRRRVALKIIKLGMDTKAVVARFEAERQALALMDHPNIAKVFDAGTTGVGKSDGNQGSEIRNQTSEIPSGRPYFVMELVQGVPITEFCHRTRCSTRQRLELFIQVCQAVQHAHQKGIIHRDLKPSNVLVSLHDGVPRPKVIDFGIAKATNQKLTEKTLFTQFATMIGTPAYMSPEQAELGNLDVDTRTDIYALGVLLYELLTGTTPFPEKRLRSLGYGEIQRVIREEEPQRPSTRLSTMAQEQRTLVARACGEELRTLGLLLRGDLDWIVMKCLEKDRGRRYETANGLAADLERHLRSEPVVARPPSTAYRLQKAFRRHRGAFVAAGSVLVALLAGTAVSTWQANVAKRESARATQAELAAARDARLAKEERDRAVAAQIQADESARQARRHAYVATLNVAAQAFADGNLGRVRALLDSQAPLAGEEDLRDFEWRYLWKASRSEAVSTLQLRPIPLCGAILSPDGSKLITTQLYDQVRVVDAGTYRPMAVLSTNVVDVALSRDGRTLAVLGYEAQAQVFDVTTLQARLTITNLSASADKVLISTDGGAVAVADASQITIWDTRAGRLLETIPIRPRRLGISAFAAAPDWSIFLTSTANTLCLWDRATRALARELPGHAGEAYSAAFSPDGRRFASGGWQDREIRLWEPRSDTPVAVFTGHAGWIGGLDFSPDGATLASGGADHTIRLWDLTELEERAVLRGHTDEVWQIRFSADGRRLISGDRGGEVNQWDASPAPPAPTQLEGAFLAGTFSPDSRAFTTIDRQGVIQTWDGTTLRELRRAVVPAVGATSGRFSPDIAALAVGLTNGQVRLYNLPSLGLTRVLDHGADQPVEALEFSANGRRLASRSARELSVWDADAGNPVYRTANLADPYWRLTPTALSSDGEQVAFGTAALGLRIVQLATGVERGIVPELWGVSALAFAPDGEHLAGAGRDHRIKLWRTGDGEEVATLKSWRQAAHALAFHPTARRLAVAKDEGGILLVDLATHQDVGSLPAEGGALWVAFSPDGNSLAAHYPTGFRFWRVPSWPQIASAPVASHRFAFPP